MVLFKRMFPVLGTGIGALVPSDITLSLSSFPKSNLSRVSSISFSEKPKISVSGLIPTSKVDEKASFGKSEEGSRSNSIGEPRLPKEEAKVVEVYSEISELKSVDQNEEQEVVEISVEEDIKGKLSSKSSFMRRRLSGGLEDAIKGAKGAMLGLWEYFGKFN